MDEEAALIIKRIYQLALEGMHPSVIAKRLHEGRVEIPSVHMARFGQGAHINQRFKDPYKWSYATVRTILQRREYTGCTVNFRTKKHFKDKRNKYVPQDQWVVFENTREAIIDQEIFDKVQCRKATGRCWKIKRRIRTAASDVLKTEDSGRRMRTTQVQISVLMISTQEPAAENAPKKRHPYAPDANRIPLFHVFL